MATSFGQGRDTSDKAANKAATAAFKYLLMPALMISDRKDDPDHERIEATPEEAPSPEDVAHQARHDALLAKAGAMAKMPGGEEYKAKLLEAAKAAGFEKFAAWSFQKWHIEEVEALVDEYTAALQEVAAQEAAAEPEKPKRTRAKTGSAVEPNDAQAKAQAAVEAAWPGTEEVPQDG